MWRGERVTGRRERNVARASASRRLEWLVERALAVEHEAATTAGARAMRAPRPRAYRGAVRAPRRRLRSTLAAGVLVALAGALLLLVGAGGPSPAPRQAAPTTTYDDRVEVVYRLVNDGALDGAYRAVAGVPATAARSGTAACAAGHDDERAWSQPSTPTRVAGRYRCTTVHGHAEMWWTDDARGLLAHATAADDGLARLFAWWLARGP
jgi:hypothetical protein